MNLGKHFVICDFKYKMRAATDEQLAQVQIVDV